ncbi:MAG: hypothetical protein A2166_03715 [Omnitrophica WOR_2 bacterium RBG_13_41_10]|nr:MAG: hypothetical protein A2166_03715 [Omnitrophica WOR_2 bacterium RBG_13_41_10]
MSGWNDSILLKEENRITTFKEGELFKANIVFPGATASLPKVRRHSNYIESRFYKQVIVEGWHKIDVGQSTYSYNLEQYPENIFIGKLYEEIIEKKEMEEWDLSYFKFVFDSEREEIESELLSFFSGIEQVIKIFTIQTDDFNLHIQILTDNTKYDRELMMKMYEIEYEIEQKHENVLLSFDHIPKIYNSENDIVIKEARQIYKKDPHRYPYEYEFYSLTTGSAQQKFSELLVAASTI